MIQVERTVWPLLQKPLITLEQSPTCLGCTKMRKSEGGIFQKRVDIPSAEATYGVDIARKGGEDNDEREDLGLWEENKVNKVSRGRYLAENN